MIFGFSWARSSGPAASLASFCGGEHGCISSLTVGHPEAVCSYIHDGRRIGNGNASPPTTYNSNCGSMLCICALLSVGALKSSEVREERILRLLATLQFSKLLVCFIIPVRIRLIQCMMQKNLHISRVKNSFLKINYLLFSD